MPQGLNCLAGWPAGVPEGELSGTQVWRELRKRHERVSRSSEPLSLVAQWPEALSNLVGEKLSYPLPLPQSCGSDWTTCSWAGVPRVGGWKQRGPTLPHSGTLFSPNTLSWDRCPFCSLGLIFSWEAGN